MNREEVFILIESISRSKNIEKLTLNYMLFDETNTGMLIKFLENNYK